MNGGCQMLRVVFMGTPAFAVPTLEGIAAAGHEIAAVYTRAPRPAGRGMAARKSPVHLIAERQGWPILTPRSLRDGAEQAGFAAHGADVAVVVAYGLILPAPVLAAPRCCCLNLHASALPRWRGAAPIQRAIMAGDAHTAATVMRMDAGLDTGPVCAVAAIAIGADMTAGELTEVMATQGAALMLQALSALQRGALTCTPQPDAGASYAPKIAKAEARLVFALPAAQVHNLVRALAPVPGAWFEVARDGARERIKVLRTALAPGGGAPGTLLDDQLTIACGRGAVRILALQRAGKRPTLAAEFLRGFALRPGSRIAE